MDLDDIEPVNLVEEGFADTIQLESMKNEPSEPEELSEGEANDLLERNDPENQDDSEGQDQDLEAEAGTSEESEESDEGAKESKGHSETVTLNEEVEYDLGDGVKISGKEAINRLKTENRIRQQFGELGQKADELKKKEAKLNQDLKIVSTHLNNLASSENKLEAIKTLVAATGQNPEEWFSKLVEEITPAIEQYNSMDESQKTLLTKDAHVKKLEAEIEALKQGQNTQRYAEQLKQQVATYISQNGLTEQEFEAAYNQINAAVAQGEFQELKNADTQTAIQAVVDYAVNNKVLDRIEGVLDKVNPELKNDNSIVKQLYSVLRNPYKSYDVTDEDLVEIVKSSFESEGAKPTEAAPKGKKKVKVISQEEAQSEDLDFLEGIEPVGVDDLQFI